MGLRTVAVAIEVAVMKPYESEEGGGHMARRRIPAQERRQLLAAAALEVMKRDGIAAATTRAICLEAGMPHGAFHYCFHSKKELYKELLASDMAVDLDEVWPRIRPDAPPVENLRVLLDAYWSQIEADPQARLVLFDLGTMALHDRGFGDLPGVESVAALSKMADHLRLVADEGGFTYVEDEGQVAQLVSALLTGVTWSWLTHRDSRRVRASLDQFACLAASIVDVRGSAA